jgi:hypothetical protein
MKYERAQEDRILAILEASGDRWVPAPVLARVALQYGRAIYVLRKHRGIPIENRSEWVDGVRHGFFRLDLNQDPIVPTNQPTETTPSPDNSHETPEQLPLFGDFHRDDG